MSTMLLEIVTPRRKVFSEQVQLVVVRAETGDIGVLPGHTPLGATLAPGVLKARLNEAEQVLFAVTGGFIEVTPTHVTVLARTAERSEEIDVERAEAAKRRAQERLTQKDIDKMDYARAQAALQRSMSRIRAKSES